MMGLFMFLGLAASMLLSRALAPSPPKAPEVAPAPPPPTPAPLPATPPEPLVGNVVESEDLTATLERQRDTKRRRSALSAIPDESSSGSNVFYKSLLGA